MCVYQMFVGTYSDTIRYASGVEVAGRGAGVYQIAFDAEKARFQLLHIIEDRLNPSYVCWNAQTQTLWAANEVQQYEGEATGAVSCYRMHTAGGWDLAGRVSSGGTNPCHVAVNRAGTLGVATNYSAGSVCLVSSAGGTLHREALFAHKGKGPRSPRQDSAHPHSALFMPDERGLLAPDLGMDRLVRYALAPDGQACLAGEVLCEAGSGPRHGAFSPDGKNLYIANELDSTVAVFCYDRAADTFVCMQRVSTQWDGKLQSTADIHVTHDGHFVYVSNRGNSTLSCFAVGQHGELTMRFSVESGGQVPRSFCLSQDDRFLFCVNQKSDVLTAFARHRETGALQYCESLCVPTPACVKLWE